MSLLETSNESNCMVLNRNKELKVGRWHRVAVDRQMKLDDALRKWNDDFRAKQDLEAQASVSHRDPSSLTLLCPLTVVDNAARI